MKIALVAQPYDAIIPPDQNSIGLIAYNTAIEMGRHADVTLYGKRRPGAGSSADLPFRVAFVSSRADEVLQHAATNYPRWAGRLGIKAVADAYPGYARAIARELDHNGPDVVHVMNYWSWCTRFKKRRPARRVVLEMQAEWLTQLDAGQVGQALAATDAVVGVSDHIVRLFRESFPNYRGNVVTAYNGVNVADFRPGPDADSRRKDVLPILFVGRVSPEKGVHTLIEAFEKVASRIPQARLDIVGGRTTMRQDFLVGISSDPLVRALGRFYDGTVATSYQRYLDGLIVKLGLTEKVRFLGHVPHLELPERYRSCAVVANPSLSESFGISMVEGMASGVPVVGTKVGGMLETVLDGETGLLVEPERPDLLADALVSLLEHPERAQLMGIKGRTRAVERFSWRARSDRLLSAYRKIMKRV